MMQTQRPATVTASASMSKNTNTFLTVNYKQSKRENESANEVSMDKCQDSEVPEELNLFTPFSSSHSNTITTNTSFIFDSEEELLDLHNQYSDDTDCEECEDCDTDCIPPIDKITPPPPLSFADDDDEYHCYAPSDEEEYAHIEYQYDDDEHLYHNDEEDEDESNEQRHKLLNKLSIMIPSLSSNNLICKASPAKSSKSKCFSFDTYNTSTPNSSSDHEQLQHDHVELGLPNMYKFACSYPALQNNENEMAIQNKTSIENVCRSQPPPRSEKRFEWNTPSAHNNGYLDQYLNAHIQSLLDETLSD